VLPEKKDVIGCTCTSTDPEAGMVKVPLDCVLDSIPVCVNALDPLEHDTLLPPTVQVFPPFTEVSVLDADKASLLLPHIYRPIKVPPLVCRTVMLCAPEVKILLPVSDMI